MILIELLRLYLETTVFNYYFDVHLDGHEDVVRLFEAIGAGRFEGYTSDYVMNELMDAKEPKRSKMMALVGAYNVTTLPITAEVMHLAELYVTAQIISASHFYDSVHIAATTAYELDCIISYNFRHINRDKTKFLTASANQEEGYASINICTAGEVLRYARGIS